MQLFLGDELRIPGAPCLGPAEIRVRMEERFAWAVGRGHSVAVLACEPSGLAALEPGRVPDVLRVMLRSLEAPFGVPEAIVTRDDGLLVLLVGPDPARLEAACHAWTAACHDLPVPGLDGPVRLALRIGYGVTQPGKRQFLETLIQVAREGLRVARCRRGSACVHTMLYDLLEGRLERERGRPGLAISASTPVLPGAPERELAGEERKAPGPPTRSQPDADAPVNGHVVSSVSPPVSVPATAIAARERELSEALEAQRRENEVLRARLDALERAREPVDVADGAAPTPPETPGQAPDKVELLERRLAKLVRSLESAEERLAQVGRASTEPGIGSVYRSVQGLAPDAPQRDLKAALMHEIFAANLKLHEQLRAWRGGGAQSGAA